MILTSLLIVAAYLAIWVYTYMLVIRVQNSLYRYFPKEATQIMGTEKFFGINRKLGILFLWRDGIKELIKKDQSINNLRNHAVKYIIASLITPLFIPIITFNLWWFMSR